MFIDESILAENSTSSFTIDSVLSLSVMSSIYDDFNAPETRIESFNLTRYEGRTLVIQVNFLNPNMLSLVAVDKDRLRIEFT